MPRKEMLTVGVALLVLISGCSLFGGAAPTSTETSTATSQEPTRYEVSLSTGDVVLRLSDLGGGYNFVAESELYQTNASEKTKLRLKEKGVLKQHKRLFEAENKSAETPRYVISSIAIYENTSAAIQDLRSSVNTLSESGKVTSREIGKTSVKVVKYQDQQGNYQTIAYIQQRNTVYYTLVTDSSRYRQEIALNLLVEMKSDLS